MNNSAFKFLGILMLLIFQTNFLVGQNCLPGYTYLSSQSEIDDFAINYPGCTNIEGSLRIDPSSQASITNLNGLSQLISIGDDLHIDNDADIIDFSGLDNLTSIGGDFETFGGVVLNSATTSFNGLQNLQTIGGRLSLRGIYENLSTLDGLNNLNSVGGDIQIALDPLEDISALSQITEVNGNLTFSSVDSLSNFDGLENITSIDGNFTMSFNQNLSNVDGLSSLTNIGGNLQFRQNNALTNLDGLSALTSIGGNLDFFTSLGLNSVIGLSNLTSINGFLKISRTALTSLDGLENIDPSGITDLEIEFNISLTTCEIESLCDYLDIPTSTAFVFTNGTNCNSVQEIQDACLALLPVDLIEFEGGISKSVVELNWKTTNELNNKGFEIEKSSDGDNWQNIGFVEGVINADQVHEYQFQDSNPFHTINYYRLKQIDLDGAFEYSDIVSVSFSNEYELQIFPNPTNDQFQISGTENAEIMIMDNIGRTISEINYTGSEINISDLPDGVYFIKINSGNTVSIKKLIKE